MGAKKITGLVALFAIVLGGIFVLGRAGSRGASAPKETVLRVYTWSNYFPDEVIQEFTKRTGLKVEFTYMSSNEELLAKLKAGASGFDIIQPSDYMVRQMIRIGMLTPLDKTKLSNLTHLEDEWKDLPYDPGGKFTVPFTWGTTGIAVNTEKVKVPADGVSWKLLLESPDPKHTSALDDMREVFAAVLKSRGRSINETDPKILDEARKDIGELKNRILMFNSEPKAFVLKEELTISHIFSCDAAQAHKENPKVQFFIPKEGGTRWTDNFAIPATSQNVAGAHQFINFVLDPDIALSIVREKLLATPNKTARAKLSQDEKSDPAVYPSPEVLQRMQYLDDLGETLQVVSRMWTELKS